MMAARTRNHPEGSRRKPASFMKSVYCSSVRSMHACAGVSLVAELDGLSDGSVAGRVPGGESNPFLAGGVEWDSEMLFAEWR
jgi:hypothetical protein